MDVEALGLETSEMVGDDEESFPHRIQMIQPLFQAEVAQIVGAEVVAEVAGEFLILFEKGILPVGPEDVVAMLDLIDNGNEFPAQPFVEADAEDLADSVRRQSPKDDLATPLKDFV